MNLADLYAQQDQDMQTFGQLRDKAWADLQQEQQSIAASFGGRENLPEHLLKRMEAQSEAYRNEWAVDTGQRYKAIIQQHAKQRIGLGEKITPVQIKEIKADPIDEKQEKLQKIIAQQQAIRKREHKRKR